MLRLVIYGIFLIILFNEQKINAVRELYGQSSGRIKSSSIDVNLSQSRNNFSKEYQLLRTNGKSPSFIQSRHYHIEQLARDNRELGQPLSYQSQILPSNYYIDGGIGTNRAGSNQEGCRLTNNFCSHDYQCCSGKCRCVRWSVMGKMSCLKKCF